jgi:hypothetical protein
VTEQFDLGDSRIKEKDWKDLLMTNVPRFSRWQQRQ